MGDEADWATEQAMLMQEDPAYQRLEYLRWCKRLLKAKNYPQVHAHKYPEFGILYKRSIDEVIAKYTKATGYYWLIEEEVDSNLPSILGESNSVATVKGMNMSVLENAEFYEGEAMRLLAIAEKLRNIPREDPFDVGRVVTWEKVFPDSVKVYKYAAIKSSDGLWYTTEKGSGRQVGFTWWGLIEAIGYKYVESVKVLDNDSALPLREVLSGAKD